jgi:hypothetical protein
MSEVNTPAASRMKGTTQTGVPMKALLISSFCLILSQPLFASEWRSLFNGKDLSGWQPYVSYQPETNAHDLVSKQQPQGFNNDPNRILSVVDG